MAEDEKASTEAESTDDLSLSELFEEKAEEETEAESEGEVKEETEAEASDESPSEQSEAEESEEPEPKAETPTAEQGQLAALLAERQKRQEAERKLAELEGEEPSETKLSSDAQIRQARIELSRDFMLETDPEYEKTYEPYFMAQVVNEDGTIKNEELLQKFYTSSSPAKFARDYAKEQLEIQSLRDPKYRERLKEEARKEVLAEIEAESKKLESTKVPNLTSATEDGSNSEPVEQEQGLGDIFKGSPL